MAKKMTGAEIRQSFIEFFEEKAIPLFPPRLLFPGETKHFFLLMPVWCNLKMFFLELTNDLTPGPQIHKMHARGWKTQ
jgi:alanyl-tRNA synthetase